VGYCYPSGLEKTLFKWDIYVPLVKEGLTDFFSLKLRKYVLFSWDINLH